MNSTFSKAVLAILLVVNGVIDLVERFTEHVIFIHIVETIGVEKTEVVKLILNNPWTLAFVSIALYCMLLVAKALFSHPPHKDEPHTIQPVGKTLPPKETASVSLRSRNQQASYAKLTYCGYRNTDLHVGKWDFEGVIEPTNEKHLDNLFKGLVLKFENEPWTNGIDTSSLIARVIYTTKSETERIDHAAWIGAKPNYGYIEIGETHELLILLGTDGQEVLVLEDKRAPHVNFPDGYSWARLQRLTDVMSIEVTLTDQGSKRRYVFDFDVEHINGKFKPTLTGSKEPCYTE